MQKDKTFLGKALRAMLVAGFATAMCPVSAYAAGTNANGVQAVQQQNQIKGTVIDEMGEPMIGVTVKVKGSSTGGAITDLDGNFSISCAPGSTLEISYVGYTTQRIKATSKPMNIKLQPDAKVMDEVVVVGYGTVKKRDMLGAISQVKSDDIKQAPTMNAMEGLQGKISGLDITRTSGEAGEEPTLLLRGNRSIEGDNSPLFVIDGISGGSISNINPNDIESIEVLKDASSTAIYGSAGANGVIIVTTKQGSKGKVQVDFNAYVGINTNAAYPDVYTGDDWINFLQYGYNAKYGQNAPDLQTLFTEKGLSEGAQAAYADNAWVNWKDLIIHTGVQQNYNVSIRGGNDKMTSYVSAGYQNEKGVFKNDNYQQFTFRAGTTYNINKIVSVGFQTTLSYKDKDSGKSQLSKSLNQIPLGYPYDPETGAFNKFPISDMTGYINLLANEQPNVYKNNSKSLSLNIAPFIELKPLKGLSFKSIFNASIGNSHSGTWDGLNTYSKLSKEVNKRYANYNTSSSLGYQWQNILTYNWKINEANDLTLTGITEYTKNTSETGKMYAENFDYDNYEWYNMNMGQNPTVGTSYTQTSKMSYAARVNYNLLGRYLLSATMRWDGASQLRDKWDSFPAVSLGWRISDEKFMEGTKGWLDNLKFRVGYGVTGNSSVKAYSSLTLVEDLADAINLGGGQVNAYVLKQNVANYHLKWEKSYNWNLGLDFGFLNGRIDGSIEWYHTDTKDVLYNRPLPTAYGLYTAKQAYQMTSNIARIKNTGVELTLNTRNIVTKDFTWNSTLTYSTNKEELVNIDMGNGTSVEDLKSLGLFLGHPVQTYYNYKKEGIWQSDEEAQAASFGKMPGQIKLGYTKNLVWDPSHVYSYEATDASGNKYIRTVNGAYYCPDEDKDGVHQYYTAAGSAATGNANDLGVYTISESDKQILGSQVPKFTIGFTNTFTYKNFDLSIQAVMRWGQMVQNGILGYISNTNQPKTFNYWTPDNPTDDFPQPNWAYSTSSEETTACTYVDGSFIKIKNITLGYTLPKKWLKSLNMTKLRIYGTIQNPFIFTKSKMLKGLDPENANNSDSHPLFKTLVFGVNVSF